MVLYEERRFGNGEGRQIIQRRFIGGKAFEYRGVVPECVVLGVLATGGFEFPIMKAEDGPAFDVPKAFAAYDEALAAFAKAATPPLVDVERRRSDDG